MLRRRLEVPTRRVPAAPPHGPGVPGANLSALVTTGGVTAAVASACILAVGLVVAAPLAVAAGSWLGPLLYALFAPVCHQIAERSFHLAEHPLAVCHRCFGFYAGFTLGLVALPVVRRFRDWLLDRPRRILFFLAPAAIDWLLPWNTAASRFATALVAAAPIALLVWAAIRELTERQSPHELSEETP